MGPFGWVLVVAVCTGHYRRVVDWSMGQRHGGNPAKAFGLSVGRCAGDVVGMWSCHRQLVVTSSKGVAFGCSVCHGATGQPLVTCSGAAPIDTAIRKTKMSCEFFVGKHADLCDACVWLVLGIIGDGIEEQSCIIMFNPKV